MYSQSVPALISKNVGNTLTNYATWGSIIYNVKSYAAKGDGITNDTSSISATILAASALGGVVVLPPGTYVTDSFTSPYNVTLWFMNGAKLSINTTKTVTINGSIDAEFYQIFSGLGTVAGLAKIKETNPKWWGALGDGVTDDAAAIQAAINATPQGGRLYFSHGNYVSNTPWSIVKEINITSQGYSNAALTGLFFSLDAYPTGTAAILVTSPDTLDHMEISNFYILNIGTSTRLVSCGIDGIYLNGTGTGAIWDSLISNVMVDGFRNGFKASWVILPKFYQCRAVTCGGRGFILDTFSTGASFIDCYAERNTFQAGFEVTASYYPTFINCHADSDKFGWFFIDSVGVNCVGLSSESCEVHAIRIQGVTTSVFVKGLTTVGSGTGTQSTFVPTLIYLISGYCEWEGLVETNPVGGSIRGYTVLCEAGSLFKGQQCKELLPYYLTPKGKSMIDGKYVTDGIPTDTGWKTSDVGLIAYDRAAVESGTTPNKYIIYGWFRKTSGNGNVLNTDWLPLRSLTGN